MVLFACYNLSGSRLKPCLTSSCSFSLYFSSYSFKRVLNNPSGLALAFWYFHLKCGPHLQLLPYVFFSVRSILGMFFLYLIILQQFFYSCSNSFAALLFYAQPKLQIRVIYNVYLHQLSCHKILLKNFHFSLGRSSTLRLFESNLSPGCPYRNDQADWNISLW